MGKPGPKRRPRSKSKIAGFPGKRRGDSQDDTRPGEDRTQEKRAALVKPPWLKKITGACRVWDELVRTMPVIPTPAQARPFADLCTCLARLQSSEAMIQREGVVLTNDRGTKIKNPRLTAAKEYRAQVQRWAGEFFLTPAATEGGRPAGEGAGEIGATLSGRWNPQRTGS